MSYSPRSGDMLDSQGNVKNEADGINSDGSISVKSISGGITDGGTTVTTAGTPVMLNADTSIKKVFVQAKSANTGKISVGDTTPIFELSAGESIEINVNNLNSVYVDASVSGEGVNWLAELL